MSLTYDRNYGSAHRSRQYVIPLMVIPIDPPDAESQHIYNGTRTKYLTNRAKTWPGKGAAFVLDPAERPSCAAIAQSPWLEERPVLTIACDFQGCYGRCVIAEACLPMDALAELRTDDFFEPARQKELELSFTQKPRTSQNARIRCTESVEPHGVVKLTCTGPSRPWLRGVVHQ